MTLHVSAGGDLIAEEIACRRGDRLVFGRFSCTLPAGGALVLTGANGAGKSSLLRVLATLLAPASGRLIWDGAPVTADIARYRMQLHYVGHADAIKPALGVAETLALWAGLRGATSPGVGAALAGFGLEALADWPCRWLSAGQRRRLALARLIATPAPIWLLDEPTASLDAAGEACLIAAIEAHRAAGGRVAAATHRPLPLSGAQTLALEDFAADPLAGLADDC